MKSASRVLVVKLNKLGDAVAFLPTMHAIRSAFPDARITMLTTPVGGELVAGTRLVDEIILSTIGEAKTPAGFIRLFREVRRRHFDFAIASSDTSSFISLILFCAGIPRRIGFGNARLASLYTVRVPYDAACSHAGLNYMISDAVGYQGAIGSSVPSLSADDINNALRILDNVGIGKGARYAVMHLGSRSLSDGQRWPAEQFAEVIKHLMARYAIRTVFVGAPDEHMPARAQLSKLDGVADLVGKTTVRELFGIIQGAALFIGHPSGPLQIAYLMGTPSVSLWGASSFTDWGPEFGKERHSVVRAQIDCLGCEADLCRRGTYDCMSLIDIAKVIDAIDAQLMERQ